MASGTIEFSTGSNGITIRLGWKETSNPAANSSVVAITSCQIKSTIWGGTWYPGGTIKINGETVVTMSYENPATHSFVFSTNGNWYDIRVHGSGKDFPWSTGAIDHDADGSKSVKIEVDLELWKDNDTDLLKYTGRYKTVALDRLYPAHKLTLNKGANTSLTVKRTASPGGGNTGSLANGATIYYGDELTVTFSASTGYNATCKVNGGAIASGATHTVTGAVTVTTTAALKTYKLTITQGANTTLTVKRGGTTLANGATITHNDELTVTFSASTGYNATCKVNGGAIASGATHTVTGAVTVTTTAALKTYKLTITQGANTTLTVKRGGTTLANGATITHNDELTVTFSASTGYNATCKVNGGAIASGATHTVTGAVTVTTTAALKTYKLTITQPAHGSITVERTSSLGGSAGALESGATLYHFDALTITVAPDAGYKIMSRTPPGNVASVTENVTVSAVLGPMATVRLYNGSTWDSYLIYVDNGTGWALCQAQVDNGKSWEPCF